jgi:hypothetical protein
LKVLLAVIFGILTHTVRKLGPSLVLFVLVFASQSMDQSPVMVAGLSIPLSVVLVTAVISFSIAIIAFKSVTLSAGRKLDQACLPTMDMWVLRKIHKFDLNIRNIRKKSSSLLEGMKVVALFLALAAIACLNSVLLGVAFLLAMCAVATIAYFAPNPTILNNWPKLRSITEAQNYSELIFDFALILGFLVIIPKGGSVLSGTIILLFAARFSGQLKALANAIRAYQNWRTRIRLTWTNRSKNVPGQEEPGE